MTFYVGHLGALVALPTPVRGRQQPWTRQSSVHDTLGGGRRVQFAPDGRRTYGWSWKFLSPALVSALERFSTGAAGPGPYVLVDPQRRNMLSANQSSAGSAAGSPAGVSTVAGSGETVGVQSTTVLQGPRALVWSLPDVVSVGRLRFDPPAGLVGFAAPPGEPWTFSAWVQGGGADPAAEVSAVLRWVRADGSGLVDTVGAPTGLTGFGFAQVVVSRDVPPAGAAGFVPELWVTPGSVAAAGSGQGMTRQGTSGWATWRSLAAWPTSGATALEAQVENDWVFGSTVDILIDLPQLDMWATARDWVLGTGMPQVSWMELPDSYDLIDQHNLSATLAEVG